MKLVTRWMVLYGTTGRNDSDGGDYHKIFDDRWDALGWAATAEANNEGTSYKTVNIRIFKVKELIDT